MSQLIQTIDELKQAVNLNRDTDITGLTPHLESAEALLARQLGGFGVIDEVLAIMVPTMAQKRALAYMRRAVGNLALYKSIPTQNVQITDAGLLRRTGGQQGDAFQWQYDEARNSLKADGWDAVEDLLQTLETTPDDFPAWLASRPAPLLVPSASVFNLFYFIDSRRLTYQALLPSMRKAETMQIRKFLAAQAVDVADLDEEQLALVQSALVSATLGIALRERQIDITESGVQVLGTSEASTAANYRKPVEDQKRIDALILYYQQQARATLDDLIASLPPLPNVPASPVSSTGIGGDRIVGL
ncbi:DUF6712 family protein [Fibrella forsythiae]|uniref:Uncharacterized protein n=1 Tax=Fibrella forsythiae TaxID=2817061 RepID=A0ABS3JAD6_9BACT|nr:DUF6712 family protein [Fibrella forsythiae]MBO0946946.1 hypothetical protein [Fibrella forsythiae]